MSSEGIMENLILCQYLVKFYSSYPENKKKWFLSSNRVKLWFIECQNIVCCFIIQVQSVNKPLGNAWEKNDL